MHRIRDLFFFSFKLNASETKQRPPFSLSMWSFVFNRDHHSRNDQHGCQQSSRHAHAFTQNGSETSAALPRVIIKTITLILDGDIAPHRIVHIEFVGIDRSLVNDQHEELREQSRFDSMNVRFRCTARPFSFRTDDG